MPLKAWLGWQAAASAAVAAALSVAIWWSQSRAIDAEGEKVEFLKQEIRKLDREIADVSDLKEQIGALLARKQVAEALQRDRLVSVQVLEQLARQRPAGVRLTAVREEQGRVFIAGLAASDREVAALLANLQSSPLFWSAELVELRAQRFSLSAPLRARRLAPARPPVQRIPSDVHPGDPK